MAPGLIVLVPRSRRGERAWTLGAALAVKVSGKVARRLSSFAELRMEDGPIRVRDLLQEAREELADCRNYLIWHIQVGGEIQASLRALEHVILAWEALEGAAATPGA